MSVVDRFKDEGYLVSPSIINSFKGDVGSFIDFVKVNQPGVSIIDDGVLNAFHTFMKGGFMSNIRILNNYEQVNESRNFSNWLGYYNKRYELFSSYLAKRSEMKPVITVSRVDKLIARNDFGLIGLVSAVRKTGNGNFMVDLEDPTGSISLLVGKSSPSFGIVGELVVDEVIGVNVRKNGRWCFVDTIIFPDVPVRETKSCDDDSCAVFISDSHVGSIDFLSDNFQQFFDWLNGECGTSAEKNLASKVKYLFFVGDLVDGVGVYPDQEKELAIKDIYKQYERVGEYLKQVPEGIKVVISPGNHDACRLALPQPPLVNGFAKALQLPNVTMVSNPATINIHAGKGFPGYDVLLYHGNSFYEFISNVPRLRKLGDERPEAVMEFLLRKRHLSPSHGATLVAPTIAEDFLLIDKVPDVFVSGHVHQSGVGSYRGVTLLNASCFQALSSYMKRMGRTVDPAKIPVMSLNNQKVHIMNFIK